MKLPILMVAVVLLLLISSSGLMTGYGQSDGSAGTSLGSAATYNVTFQKENLSQGVIWGVVVNSSSFYSLGNQVVIQLPDGDYNYSIVVENKSFKPVYGNGAFLVSGHPLNIPVEFEGVTYPVVFNERGLPSNVSWSVNVDGSNRSMETGNGSTGNYMVVDMINGSHTWAAFSSGGYISFPQNGSFSVDGNMTVINLQFELAYSQVVFISVGIPVNVSWSVILNGTVKYSNASTIVFLVPYGAYQYAVSTSYGGYHSFTGQKELIVNKSSVYVDVYFWGRNYTVAFREVGLPAGVQWSLDIGPWIYNSTNSTIVTFLPNGTYYYTLSVMGMAYAPLNRTGSLIVNGSGLNINVTFELLTYQVTFNRSGPSDMKWQVVIDGDNITTNSSRIAFREVYGEYNFTVSVFNQDYFPSPESGTVYVTANTSVIVVFTPVTFRQIFIEKGLPENFTWTVSLGNATIVSSNGSVTFNEMNGTYPFVVFAKNYTVFPSSGMITVSGGSEALDVRFISYIYVSFGVSGIPKGSQWSVTIDGRQFNSSSQILSVFVPNGTYYYVPISTGNFTYSVLLPPGYSLTSENSFNATASVMVALVGQPTGSGLFNSMGEYLIVIVALVGTALIITAVSLIIKKKGGK